MFEALKNSKGGGKKGTLWRHHHPPAKKKTSSPHSLEIEKQTDSSLAQGLPKSGLAVESSRCVLSVVFLVCKITGCDL